MTAVLPVAAVLLCLYAAYTAADTARDMARLNEALQRLAQAQDTLARLDQESER